MTDAGVTDIVNPPVDGALGQTAAERAAAAAAAQAAASAIPAPTREAALSEIARLKKDRDFGGKLLAGAPEETKRWRELHTVAAAPASTDEDAAELTKRFTALQRFGFPSPDSEAGKDLLATMSGKPISVELHRQVEARRTALMADKGFVQKYMDGDQEARRVFMTVNVLMAAQVERRSA
jgi:hypothetical protein